MKITTTPNAQGLTEVLVRKGEALNPKEHAPKSIKINGTLQSVNQFIAGKDYLFKDPQKSHLIINKTVGTLELHVGDTDPYTEHVIKGSLERDQNLGAFKLNSDFRWSVAALVKFLRTMKFFFANKDEHKVLVESLQKWNAKIVTVLQEHNDQTGNSLMHLEKKVEEVQLKRKFKLNIPIFKGYPKVSFDVEIGLDPKSNAVDLYLISDELIELEYVQCEKHLADEIEKMTIPFSKIEIA